MRAISCPAATLVRRVKTALILRSLNRFLTDMLCVVEHRDDLTPRALLIRAECRAIARTARDSVFISPENSLCIPLILPYIRESARL